ncbi:hypothetical protein MYX64_08785 [Nitrospinae bacterium AH_259_B05_G02_I21]|nr:hypothetical protein [Nitrospinae bacterium AH_259_B05_G02_I21]
MGTVIRNIMLMIGMTAIIMGVTLGEVRDAVAQKVGPQFFTEFCVDTTGGTAELTAARKKCLCTALLGARDDRFGVGFRHGFIRPANPNDLPQIGCLLVEEESFLCFGVAACDEFDEKCATLVAALAEANGCGIGKD